MGLVAFDTLKFANKLEAEGISRRQAEIFAEAMTDAYKASDLATKQDLKMLEHKLNTGISNVRTELKEEIANVRTELKEDIANLRTELKEDIHNLDTEIKLVKQELGSIKWIGKLLIGGVVTSILAQFVNMFFKFV